MTPRISDAALDLNDAERLEAVRILGRVRSDIRLALDALSALDRATRRDLWPHRSSDSCEPERDLRDALAHVDAALGYEAKR